MSNPDPADRFAIVKLHPHQPAPDNAIGWGSIDAVMEHVVDSNVRNDALDLLSDAAAALGQLERTRAQENQILARGLQVLNDSIELLTKRMDALEAERAAQAKADAEAEARRIADFLDSLPDPDDVYPSGELHSLPPTAARDQGDLPRELSRGAPPPEGDLPDPETLSHPQTPKYRQPAAISLNADDD